MGDEIFTIMKAGYDLRKSLKPYLKDIFREAHENGSPLMRPMFYEFPEDAACWDLSDQYMFGPDYLVAPILKPDTFERTVYLPAGQWEDIHTGEAFSGGRAVKVHAPLEYIPVFKRKV